MLKKRLRKRLGIEDDYTNRWKINDRLRRDHGTMRKQLSDDSFKMERNIYKLYEGQKELRRNADDVAFAMKYLETLSKKFKAGVDIGIKDGSWWVICYVEKWHGITKFYKLRDGKDVADFIEANKLNDPHIDAPMEMKGFLLDGMK